MLKVRLDQSFSVHIESPSYAIYGYTIKKKSVWVKTTYCKIWDSVVWYLSSFAVVVAVIYFTFMVALTEYLKQKDDTIWTIAYAETEKQPEPLPIILLNVAGISSAIVTPYTISMKKKTDESSRTIEYCAPDFFTPGCWGNTEVFILFHVQS